MSRGTVKIPMDPNFSFATTEYDRPADKDKYRSIIGSLLYIANGTRPDIAFVTSLLSQVVGNPMEKHFMAAIRVIKYLHQSSDYCLFYSKDQRKDIRVYTDADYAACTTTSRSRSGILIFFGDSLVTWGSNKHSSVSLSTCEAELYAMVEGTKEGLTIQALSEEMWTGKQVDPDDSPRPSTIQIHPKRIGIPKSTVTVNCDNRSAISVAVNPDSNKSIKHVRVRFHWMKERINENRVSVEWVGTKEQVADIMKKPLAREPFERLRKQLGMRRLAELNDETH
jgi:hypothetical protein